MLAQALVSIMAFAAQGIAVPTSGAALVARQGYTESCTATYTVKPGDNCNVIRDSLGGVFTLQEFYSWNPQVNSFCSNLFPGDVVCVGVNNSTGPVPACPAPVKPGLTSECTSCYKVIEGDSCAAIFADNDITLAQFRAWNPDINTGCANLEIGYNYCISAGEAEDDAEPAGSARRAIM